MNDLIQKYYSLTDTEKRHRILVSICAHKEIGFENIRIIDYLWKLRYNSEPDCAIVKDSFLMAFQEILSLDSEILSDIQWKNSQQKLFQYGCLLGLEDYQFQTPCGKNFFVLEYSNFAAFYLQSGKKEALYDVSSRIPEQFGLYQIFAPLRSGIDHFFQKRN